MLEKNEAVEEAIWPGICAKRALDEGLSMSSSCLTSSGVNIDGEEMTDVT